MGFPKLMSAAALTCALAIPVQTTVAFAGNGALIHKVGYRHDWHQRYYGGISYVSDYGLQYAPTYHYRHHGSDVSVKVYIGSQESPRYRQEARPLILELPK
ncbi:hypothetical protein [Oricola nitratireducens]|jgi:hypothetical protein|uniref:hypothetical protein n=1 Tax=Oricola nitratireducens TaxID=2775868 RepID=UPI0018660193|nr:hypothetical protein [Oricola nitratireducens]